MMPPMKVTQSAAPQAVEKQRTWASLMKVESLGDFDDPNVSGEKIIPIAKKVTAAKNRVVHPISDQFWLQLSPSFWLQISPFSCGRGNEFGIASR